MFASLPSPVASVSLVVISTTSGATSDAVITTSGGIAVASGGIALSPISSTSSKDRFFWSDRPVVSA